MGSVKVEKTFKFLENFLKSEKKGRKSPMGMRPIGFNPPMVINYRD